MRNVLLFVSLILTLITVGGCDSKGREYDRMLDRADALMTDHPASALTLINSLDTAGCSRARIARYALLLTKARDKNYLIPTNDSLILKAVNYYCGHENSEEIEALYYYGNVFYSIDSINNAMPILEMAYDLASEKKNWFYTGMSARVLSDIYNKSFLYPSQIKYALLAKKAFEKYEDINKIEDHRYSNWMDVSIVSYLADTDQYKRCINYCDSVESLPQWEDFYYRNYILIDKAKAYCGVGKPHESIKIYKSLIEDGYPMEGWNWNRLCDYYYQNGELDNARTVLDSAKMHIQYSQDIIYIDYLENLLTSKTENTNNRLESLEKLLNTVVESNNAYKLSSPIPVIITSYKSRAKEYKRYITNQKIIFGISVTILILIIIGGGIILYRRNRVKRRENILLKNEILNVNSQNADLEERINKITTEHNNIIAQYSKELSRISREDAKKQSVLLSSILNNENEYCTQLYLVNEKERNNSPFIRNSIKTHTSEKSLAQIDCWIDAYSGGFIDAILTNFPRMRQSRLRLVRYLYAGFNLETILLLLNLNSRNTFDHAKWDLKKNINAKETWIGTDRETVLKKLHLI